jgi:hypothetical protein
VFSIEIDPGPAEGEAWGRITVGDFSERFRAALCYWSASDYRASWRAASEVLETGPSATSCLVTSIIEPAMSNYVMCWPLYRDGDLVRVQNSLIFLDELGSPFAPAAPWLSVLPRETVNEDGWPISEWSVPLAAVREFFRDGERSGLT